MKVLSLFDGISCGYQALKELRIPVSRYVAYEVDPMAIYVSKRNHPEIEHRGSVIGADFREFHGFDLIIGGSPCQGFSAMGYEMGFDDDRSSLYFEFKRALRESWIRDFMLENVLMRWEYENYITKDLRVTPIKIDSQLVSAQLRCRNYWASFPIHQPQPINVTLADVLHQPGEWIDLRKYKVNKTPSREYMWGNGVYGKCPNLTNRDKSWCLTTKQDRAPNAGLIAFEDFCRYLTPIECERLQTLPDNYTQGVSDTRRYALLGNCWTVAVIKHIFGCYKLARAWV